MALLLAWMGVEKAEAPQEKDEALPAYLSRFISVEKIKQIKNEKDGEGVIFFETTFRKADERKKVSSNIDWTAMTHGSLRKFLPKKDNPVTDFAQSWSTDPTFRALAVKHLRKIIKEDVQAIMLNPVFGTLWRTICSDRKHEARDELVEAFSLQINELKDAEEKAGAKAWVEESYDYAAEVLEIIDSVPEAERFPCVFLDPTMGVAHTGTDPNNGDDDDINRPITAFTRAELLEIGRSCDPRILRRLGRVLTRLTYVENPADMPRHIAATSDEEVPKIPVALASDEHKGKFWKILLHTIVPGTMLSSRPAALLAALSLRLGITPLTQAAERGMTSFRGNWSDVDVPENWTVSCLSLLLDADRAYRHRQKSRASESDDKNASEKPLSLLRESDRTLFENLCTFKMLELNFDSSLTARVGWTPDKTMMPIGPVVSCRSCKYPRSVTIMGKSGKCGICLLTEDGSSKEAVKSLHTRVSMEDTESTRTTWVECSVKSCRAQYVVYDIDGLRVRPKCYYCRHTEISAPCVECKQCLNRVIWPEAYRTSSFVASDYTCPACCSGRDTTVDVESTARKISAENSLSWIIRDSKDPDSHPFTNRSIYHTISTIGIDDFRTRFTLFPPIENPLTLGEKLIRNTPVLVSTLQNRISQRQTEQISCSLCFSTFRRDAVNPACGRRGCFQRICKECLSGWYGLNKAGRIINIAALSCPFCRRFPSSRTLAKYGMGIHAVRNLANAIRDKGTWIYAWCRDCHTAKEYVERVCARGMPAEVRKWTCDDCQEERLEEERIRAEQALANAQAARDAQTEEAAEAARRAVEATRRMRECPGCGTMTQKTSGCGHIFCTVKGCKTHWCYFCGEKSTADYIYEHMERMHDGLLGEVDDDIDDEDEDYWG